MAAYPNTIFTAGTRVVPRQNVATDVAADGTVRGRKLMATEVYDILLHHGLLTAAEAETLEDFYEATETEVITFTWRSVDYEAYWVGKPAVEYVGGDTWAVSSSLVGRRVDGN
jgi:hypothetical protein